MLRTRTDCYRSFSDAAPPQQVGEEPQEWLALIAIEAWPEEPFALSSRGASLRLPQPVPVLVGNDECVAVIISQIADEGLVSDQVPVELLARGEPLRLRATSGLERLLIQLVIEIPDQGEQYGLLARLQRVFGALDESFAQRTHVAQSGLPPCLRLKLANLLRPGEACLSAKNSKRL